MGDDSRNEGHDREGRELSPMPLSAHFVGCESGGLDCPVAKCDTDKRG
jgi:hypothetical protein